MTDEALKTLNTSVLGTLLLVALGAIGWLVKAWQSEAAARVADAKAFGDKLLESQKLTATTAEGLGKVADAQERFDRERLERELSLHRQTNPEEMRPVVLPRSGKR